MNVVELAVSVSFECTYLKVVWLINDTCRKYHRYCDILDKNVGDVIGSVNADTFPTTFKKKILLIVASL